MDLSSPFKNIHIQEEFTILPYQFSAYYSKFYPSKLIINWLCRNDIKLLKNRELCFTVKNERYIRYQSFETLIQFKNRLQKLLPIKIDVGAIYNNEPRYYNENKQTVDLIFISIKR